MTDLPYHNYKKGTVAIPALNEMGELPEGEYEATLEEIEAVFGSSNGRRRLLMAHVHRAARNLKEAGVKAMWVDGSFVRDKAEPNDIDGCWGYGSGVDLAKIDSVFAGKNAREETMKKYRLDFFIARIIEDASGLPFPGFFSSIEKVMQKEFWL